MQYKGWLPYIKSSENLTLSIKVEIHGFKKIVKLDIIKINKLKTSVFKIFIS